MALSDLYFLQMIVGSTSVLSTVQVCYISKHAMPTHSSFVITLTLTMITCDIGIIYQRGIKARLLQLQNQRSLFQFRGKHKIKKRCSFVSFCSYQPLLYVLDVLLFWSQLQLKGVTLRIML